MLLHHYKLEQEYEDITGTKIMGKFVFSLLYRPLAVNLYKRNHAYGGQLEMTATHELEYDFCNGSVSSSSLYLNV